MVHSRLNSNVKLSSQINFLGFDDTSIEENSDTQIDFHDQNSYHFITFISSNFGIFFNVGCNEF